MSYVSSSVSHHNVSEMLFSSSRKLFAPHPIDKREKGGLIKQIKEYQQKNRILKQKQSNLHESLSDLRKLVKVVDNENKEYLELIQQQTESLKEEKDRLEKALHACHKNLNHFKRCAMFWREFL